MDFFPEFMRNQANKVAPRSQHTEGVEGFLYDGADGGQVVIWTCHENASTEVHAHAYDEYITVIQGAFTLLIGDEDIPLSPGDEYVIPKGVSHGGSVIAGTRIISAFGGQRAKREDDPQ
jgi:quercetin dioxygenase-like cupin family protein